MSVLTDEQWQALRYSVSTQLNIVLDFCSNAVIISLFVCVKAADLEIYAAIDSFGCEIAINIIVNRPDSSFRPFAVGKLPCDCLFGFGVARRQR